MDKWSPVIRHALRFAVAGGGIHGIVGTNKLALVQGRNSPAPQPYEQSAEYQRAYLPELWEQTPGWTTVFVPVRTDAAAKSGQVAISLTDPGQAHIRNVTLRKVK